MNKDYALRRTILAAMNSVGHAELRQIAAALGPDWITPPKRASLRQMLRIMEKERLVMRMRVGVFRALAGSGWGGLGSSEEIVRCISACLQECGGVMRVGDVLEDFTDHRIWGPDEREGQSGRIHQIVGDTACFWQEGDHIGLASGQPSACVGPSVTNAPIRPGEATLDL